MLKWLFSFFEVFRHIHILPHEMRLILEMNWQLATSPPSRLYALQQFSQGRYRMRFIHCKNQKEYITWKANMFGIDNIRYIEKNGYSQKEAYSFSTKCFDLDNKINNNKIIPEWLINSIDERGIAIWFMDDGSTMIKKNSNGTFSCFSKISTNNFDYDNNCKLAKLFLRYNIYCKIVIIKKKYYELVFNKKNTLKLFELIKPYMHNNLNYKLNYNRDNNYIWNNKFMNYGTSIITSKEYVLKSRNINVYDIEVKDNHNFIIATRNKKEYINGPIVSNCHHLAGEIFSKALQKLNTQYLLGLSATMNRKDGLTKIFKMYLGEICYKDKEKKDDNVLVRVVKFKVDDEEYDRDEVDYRGNIAYIKMISKISEYNNRSELIVNILKTEIKNNNSIQFIVLAHTKAQLNYLYNSISYNEVSTVGFYIGGMKEKDLKESEKKQIILATYSMAAEALDIKTLSALLFASPKTDIEQSVGRILRTKHSQPLIIDILDQHQIFKKQFDKRRKFYMKNNYKILKTSHDKYLKYIEKVDNNKEGDYDKLWELNYDPNEKVKLKKNCINFPDMLTTKVIEENNNKFDIELNDDYNYKVNSKSKKCLIKID